MNISGVLVYTVAKQTDAVVTQLTAIDGVEIHGSENGKLIVTVEKDNIGDMADQVMQFQGIPGIMSVAMVYQHSEDKEILDFEEVYLEEPSACSANSGNENNIQEVQS